MLYVPWDCKINDYPAIKNHLNEFKSDLTSRPEVKRKRYKWYCLSRYNSNAIDNFYMPKIVWAEISQKPAFCIDLKEHMVLNSGYILNSFDEEYPLYYLVALLNSNVTNWIFRRISSILATSMRFTNQYVSNIPIVNTDNTTKEKIIQLSKSLIENIEQFNSSNVTPPQRKILNRQIKVIQDELNRIIYELYDLTDDEIAIIEESIN